MDILFVCTGNTCRSPIAEGYLRSLNIENLKVSSCGLCADGSRVSQNSAAVMGEIGIDITHHVSRQITKDDVKTADRIICMSNSHKQMLESLGIKAEVLGNGIPDPYGKDLNEYRRCRDEIIREIDKLFRTISVVPITETHIKDIANLEKECFSNPWSEKTIAEAYKNGTKFFVAIKNLKVLGYAGISAVLDEGYITNIAVLEKYRKQGVASALIENLFLFAKQNSLKFISLEVRESNIPAITLYNKFGFKKEGFRKNFYENPRENAIIMTKRFD